MKKAQTPMMMQYLEIKNQHPDEILFFRLGDFYEMFFDDALLASQELEITLTGREGGNGTRVPMCGVPYHAAENYLARLVQKGPKSGQRYREARSHQDHLAGDGLVRFDVDG